jgi:hypothetical protein
VALLGDAAHLGTAFLGQVRKAGLEVETNVHKGAGRRVDDVSRKLHGLHTAVNVTHALIASLITTLTVNMVGIHNTPPAVAASGH